MIDDAALLLELTPTAERLMERHLSTSKYWYPHEYVPWGQGTDLFERDDFDPDAAGLDDVARSALFVGLLTEDNLPYYFRDIERMFGKNDVWGEWARRWTAEEGRHSIAIRDYLTITQSLDPWELEDARMQQVCGGQVPEPAGPAEGFVYVALQELATRISHRNTGKLLHDELGRSLMSRVATDENFHYLFYRDVVTAALEVDASRMVLAMESEITGFDMPGTGIPDFKQHSKAIANAGVYNLAIHYDQILSPVVLKHWKLEALEGLNDEAEQSRERIMKYLVRFEKVAKRVAARQERHQAEALVDA